MTTIYGIKNCDTVKKAIRWLTTHNIEHRFHDFRVDGVDHDLINHWLQQTSLDKLVNKRSTSWKQLSETERGSLCIETAAGLCVQYETLIKRPVLEHKDEIHFGFSEKDYGYIFDIASI